MGSGASTSKPKPTRHNAYTSNHRMNALYGRIYGDPGRRMNFTSLSRHYLDRPKTPPASDKQLKVVNLDLKLEENKRAHHTDEYELDNLIIRRGQSFDVTLTFDRPYNEDNDHISLEMRIGEPPHKISKRTIVKVPFSEPNPYTWSAKMLSKDGNSISLRMFSPADICIGQYKFGVDIKTGEGDDAVKSQHYMKEPIYVLFNPWCKDDTVYMEDELEKEEYVLNDKGVIFYGNARHPRPRAWAFGQFDKEVFMAVQSMLETGMQLWARKNAVFVARAMSGMTNAPDDGGVLIGNWSGKYSDGVPPTRWTGSIAILEQYYKTKEPVKYGQCWVFSGVLTTVLRCLGIPTRSVTNFSSAHDTDGSLTIDHHYDTVGNSLEMYNDDSVWNYHVWNECWMTRPDLPTGYGGWQAVDATPQETSEGFFWTGPAPLAAVKQGHVYLPCDTGFVFAEVNADRVNWECIETHDGYVDMVPIGTRKNVIGKCISTKAVSSDDRNDITHLYKHPEGSEEERMAVRCAVEHGTRPYTYDQDEKPDDVQLQIDLEDDVMIGQSFDVKILVANKSSEKRTVDIYISTHACHYTGVPIKNSKLKSEHIDLIIDGKEELDVKMKVTSADYLDKLVDQTCMKIYTMAKVRETNQMWSDQDDFRVETPDLVLESEGEIRVGKPFKVKVYMKNPLPKKLSSCTLAVEGPGLQRPKVIKISDIGPDGELKTEIQLSPRKAGKRVVIVSFDADLMSQITGSLNVQVTK